MVGDAIKRRISALLQRYGESFLINATLPAQGVFIRMTSSDLHVYYVDAESVSVARPALILIVAADTNLDVSDEITRDGRVLEVRKRYFVRVNDTPVYMLATMD